MNNQITVMNNQNQSINVDCICCFTNNANNKKYLFYTNNEVVQDGLIKMYVAEINDIIVEITPDEWNDLKLVMQNIIKGENANITFNSVQNNIKLGGEKVIALNAQNINSIKNSYSSNIQLLEANTPISNKDLLSQSFGSGISQMNIDTPKSEPNNLISNSTALDLENAAANLDVVSKPVSNEINFEMPTQAPQTVSSGGVLEVNTGNSSGTDLNENNFNNLTDFMKEQGSENTSKPLGAGESSANKELDNNPFKVSDAPNIFDVPPVEFNNNTNSETSPTLNSEDKSVDSNVNIFDNNVIPETNLVPEVNNNDSNKTLFDGLPTVPSVSELKNEELNATSTKSSVIDNTSLDDNILEARIAIERENYNLFMSLANNSKRMAELLEKQVQTKNINNLENTASNLFNVNGALDESLLGFGSK